MRKLLVTIVFLGSIINGIGQEKKLNIALVSRLDTTFTVLASSTAFAANQEKELDIKLRDHWMEGILTYVDTTITILQWEEFPAELDSLRELTGGFGKIRKKLHGWLSGLRDKDGYDIVILISKSDVQSKGFPSATYNQLDGHSYGWVLKKNFAFTLNEIHIIDTETFKVLARPSQPYGTGITTGKLGGKIKKPVEEITAEDVNLAIEGILRIDKRTIIKICEELRPLQLAIKYEEQLKSNK
jgi:hypothetical protein